MKIKQEFFGFNPVMWMGVVEDNDDPLKMGRLRVRIFGWHTQETGGAAAPSTPGGTQTSINGGNSHDGPNINDTAYARAYFFNFGIDVNDTTTYPPNQVPREDRQARGFPVPGGDLAGLLDENGEPVAPPMSQIPELASGKGGGGGGGGGGAGSTGGGTASEEVPYDDLPWAQCMIGHGGSNSGIGGSLNGIMRGTWVMGMFLDGDIGREPLVMGAIPGIPLEYSQGPDKGFYDPKIGNEPFPREPDSKHHADLHDGEPCWDIDEPDTNRLSRNDKEFEHPIFKDKKRIQATPIETTKGYQWEEPVMHSNHEEVGDAEDKKWDPDFKSKYPYNHVSESESGHIIEVDDTPDNERLHVYHRKGTYIEVDKDGNRVDKVVNDKLDIIDRRHLHYIKDDYNISSDLDINIKARGIYITADGVGEVSGASGARGDIHLKGNVVIDGNLMVNGSAQIKTGAKSASVTGITGATIVVKDGIVVAGG